MKNIQNFEKSFQVLFNNVHEVMCPNVNVSVELGKRCLLSSFQLRDFFFTSSVYSHVYDS
jgi:hypothetical protein